MTERVRRRKSKWDVVEETCDVPGETGQGNVSSAKAGEFIHNEVSQAEWNSSKRSEMDATTTLKINDKSDFLRWQNLSGNKDEMEVEKATANYNDIPKSITACGDYQKDNTSPGRSGRRRKDHSRSPEGGWNRSCRSRSRTPPHGLRCESEGWNERARSGSRVSTPPCNDFAAGKCMKGNQCRFSHDSGGQDGGFLEKIDPIMNTRSANTCYDFLKGYCSRGSSCRYAHQGAPVNNHEVRETTYKRIDVNASSVEDYRPDPRWTQGTIPCKFFASGHCRNGENCRFSHEVLRDDNNQQTNYPQYMVTMDRGFDGKILNEPDNDCRRTWETPKNILGGPTSRDRQSERDECVFTPWSSDEDVTNMGAPELSSHGKSSNTPSMEYNNQNPLHQNRNGQNFYPSNSGSGNTTGFSYQNSQPQNPSGVNSYPSNSHSTSTTNLGFNHQHLQPQHPSGKNIYPPNSESSNTTNMFNHYGSQTQISSSQNIRPPNSESAINTGMGLNHQTSQPQNPSGHNIYPPNSESSTATNMGLNHQISQPQIPSGQKIFPPNSESPTTINMGFNHQTPQPPISSGQNNYPPNLRSVNTTSTGFSRQISQPQIPSGQKVFPPNSESPSTINMGFNHQTLQPPIPSGQNNYPPNLGSVNTIGTGFNRQISQPQNPTGHNIYPPNSISGNTFSNMVPVSVQSFNHSGQSIYPPSNFSGNNMNQPSLQNFSINGQGQNLSGPSSEKLVEVNQNMPQMITVTPATRNTMTSEQVAQITNLSGLLPQLYAAALSSANASGFLPPLLNSGGVVAPVPSPFGQPNQVISSQSQPEPLKINMMATAVNPFQNGIISVETSQTPSNNSLLPFNGEVDGGNISKTESSDTKRLEQVANPEVKEMNEKEVDTIKEQEVSNGDEEIDADGHIDEGSGEKNKDLKGMRMFKSALVEFVKEALKPKWKEGQMGRDTHKTIVKKVVEKVTSTTKESQIPQTQHKIDQYLASCKPRLTKLVQIAYSFHVIRYLSSEEYSIQIRQCSGDETSVLHQIQDPQIEEMVVQQGEQNILAESQDSNLNSNVPQSFKSISSEFFFATTFGLYAWI
ncbi:hypothetical protein GIB67_036087, partial [Kingdonia uniflora]